MTDKKQNPAEIYLVPDAEHGHVWSDDPAPGEGMREEDATRYVREDLVPASNEVLANSIAELTRKNSELQARVSEQSKVVEHIAKAVGEEADPMACWEAVDALKAQVEQLRGWSTELVNKDVVSIGGEITGYVVGYEMLDKLGELLNNPPAQCLVEVRAQAVEDFYKALMRSPNISVTGKEIIAGIYLCRPKQLHPQVTTQDKCLVCGGYHGNNMQCPNLLPMAKAGE